MAVHRRGGTLWAPVLGQPRGLNWLISKCQSSWRCRTRSPGQRPLQPEESGGLCGPSALRPELPWDPVGFITATPSHLGTLGVHRRAEPPALLRVWVCPMRMRALEEMMDKQKLMRMTDRSERMYLRGQRCQCPTGRRLHGSRGPVGTPRPRHHLPPADVAATAVMTAISTASTTTTISTIHDASTVISAINHHHDHTATATATFSLLRAQSQHTAGCQGGPCGASEHS